MILHVFHVLELDITRCMNYFVCFTARVWSGVVAGKKPEPGPAYSLTDQFPLWQKPGYSAQISAASSNQSSSPMPPSTGSPYTPSFRPVLSQPLMTPPAIVEQVESDRSRSTLQSSREGDLKRDRSRSDGRYGEPSEKVTFNVESDEDVDGGIGSNSCSSGDSAQPGQSTCSSSVCVNCQEDIHPKESTVQSPTEPPSRYSRQKPPNLRLNVNTHGHKEDSVRHDHNHRRKWNPQTKWDYERSPSSSDSYERGGRLDGRDRSADRPYRGRSRGRARRPNTKPASHSRSYGERSVNEASRELSSPSPPQPVQRTSSTPSSEDSPHPNIHANRDHRQEHRTSHPGHNQHRDHYHGQAAQERDYYRGRGRPRSQTHGYEQHYQGYEQQYPGYQRGHASPHHRTYHDNTQQAYHHRYHSQSHQGTSAGTHWDQGYHRHGNPGAEDGDNQQGFGLHNSTKDSQTIHGGKQKWMWKK